MPRTVVINLTLGTPTWLLWCQTCNLPSGVEWPILNLTGSGISEISRIWRCAEDPTHRRGDE